jgi:universal stress protein E
MPDKKRVLVVVDPTATFHPSIERATWLARHTPTQIVLYISDYAPQVADPRSPSAAAASARAAVIDRHRKRLEQIAAPLRSGGLDVEIDARWDFPLYDSIVRKAEDVRADFVIKDTHFHSALNRAIFTNTDWNLIRNCAATLWLAKPRPTGQRPCFVAAVDPLHERDKPAALDKRIVETAQSLAAALNGDVHIFHAFDVAVAFAVSTNAMTMPIAMPLNDIADAMQATHTEAVERVCKEHGVPADHMHVLQGGTRTQLLALTDQLRADAVVMGAISRSGLKGLFIGNTAEDVLDRLHCDLIIVKPAGFEAILES